jgi:putative membrane protein insertion efficiency factor
MSRFLQILIKAYAYAVSPFLGRNCRFHPTCSAYAQEALETHGVLKGGWLSVQRICKCHPFHKGPISDPVPDKD